MSHINTKNSINDQYWQRLADEPQKAYASFQVYLHLGPDRSISEAYRQVTGREARKPPGRWNEWAKTHDWEWRARDYDLHMERVKQEAAEEEARLQEQQWLRRKAESREHSWQLGNQLINRAEQMLKFPLISQTSDQIIEKRQHSDGTEYEVTINRTIISPTEWNLSTMVKFAETGFKLIQLAVGLPTEITSSTDAPDQLESKVSQEEIDNRVLELLERARSRYEASKKDEPEKPN